MRRRQKMPCNPLMTEMRAVVLTYRVSHRWITLLLPVSLRSLRHRHLQALPARGVFLGGSGVSRGAAMRVRSTRHGVAQALDIRPTTAGRVMAVPLCPVAHPTAPPASRDGAHEPL